MSRPAVQVAARVAQPGGGGRSLGGAASVFPQTVGRHSYREGETTFFFLAEHTAIFMCKCCNLFSPSQSELLSHVSEKHAEEGVSVDDIIIPLRPLSTPEPSNPGKAGDGKGAGRREARVRDDAPCALVRLHSALPLWSGGRRNLEIYISDPESRISCLVGDLFK